MKILVADDDLVSLRLMQRTLESSGYCVITARNGREAVDILSEPDAPRLALIDWVMPEMDGPDVCRTIRSQTDAPYVYIVLLTSRQSSEDVVSGLEAGADDYLTKPYDPAELKARLHTGRRVLELEDKLVEAREEMRYKADHDALTTLWNRAGTLSLLRGELSRASRNGDPVSLMLCDVDHFKQINDSHGHLAGDEVLRQVSARLLDMVRPHDCVGRYGGEEFLIVFGGCSELNLRRRAEEIREGISRVPFTFQNLLLPVTVSIGAITIEMWDKSIPTDVYLKEADDALYRAKAAGRNRVVIAQSALAA